MKNISKQKNSGWIPNQSILKIKLCVFLIATFLIQAQTYTFGQQQRITLSLENKPVSELIDRIEDETPYRFMYLSDEVDTQRKVHVKVQNATVEQLLDLVFKDTPIDYSIVEKQIILTRKKQVPTTTTPPPPRTNVLREQDPVTGTVSDAEGPISGVVVTIKGTDISTLTDENGFFTLEASRGDTLVFTYPAYETLEQMVGNELNFTIKMTEAITEISEVVVNAGYYQVKDKERTGSIYRITSEEIEKQPVNNVLGALEGRIPGVEVTPTTGIAGGGFKVRIRGQNSIDAGNEPLYIIDGVPYSMESLSSYRLSMEILPQFNINPLNTLDAQSIESIEVLKDADATAIYGSRGANGVILINTKKGKPGKTKFSVDASTSIISVTKFMELLNTEQYLEMRKHAFENDGINLYPETAYDINGTWDKNRYTDWQKELAGGTAINQNIRISVSGGNQQTKFNLGGSFMKETTIFPGSYNYKNTSVFANIAHNSKNENFGMHFSFQYGLDSNNLPDSDPFRTALSLAPNAPELFDVNGELNWENSTWTNPLASLKGSYSNKSRNLIANGILTFKLIKGIKFKTNLGYTISDLDELRLIPHTIHNPAYGLTSENSNSFHSNGQRESWIIEPQLDVFRQLGKGKINLSIGGTFEKQNHKQLEILAIGYPSNLLIGQLISASQLTILGDLNNHYNYIAGYTRLNYNYDNKYIFNLTGRRDGSSRFGSNNRFANFGAIGAAWVFSEENFLTEISWLNFGKLRASFGTTGNDQIGDYQYLRTFSVSNVSYDGNIGILPTRLFNPDYGWEKNKKTEVALELSFFKNRINLETAYYDNRSDNLLLGMPLPGTTGFPYINSNLDATVKNTGWEFNLQTLNINNSNFNWRTILSLTFSKNELVSFDGLEESTYANRFAIGHSLNITKLFNYTGINPQTGVFEFEDYNGDGIISPPYDNQYIADLSPKMMGSLSNSIEYKGWSIDFMFQYIKKQAYNEYRRFQYAGALSNQPIGVLNNWSEANPNAKYQTLTSGKNYEAFLAHSRFNSSTGVISDASFLRLKTASISYKVKIDHNINCTLFLQGQNLLTFTKFKGGDPERNTDYLPPLKRLLIGAKVEF